MSQVDRLSKDADIDIGALFLSLRRNWLLIVTGAVILAAFSWAVCLLATAEYRSEVRILLESRETLLVPSAGEAEADHSLTGIEGVNSQIELLTSGNVLQEASSKLKLTDDEAFISTDIKPWTRLLILLGMRSNPAHMTPEERVFQKLRQNLLVSNVAGSQVIAVQYTSENPEKAANIANAVADAYIELHGAAKLVSDSNNARWLASEIEELRGQVRISEKKVADYRASHGALDGQTNSAIAAQQLSDVKHELGRLSADRAASEERTANVRQALDSGASVDTLPSLGVSGIMQRLAERRIELNSQIADLSVSLLDGHPRIKALRTQLADIDRQINAEGRKLLATLNSELNATKLREEELNTELNRLKEQAAKTGIQEVQFRALEREAVAQRQLLEAYLTRFRDATSGAERHVELTDAQILSRADVPSVPYSPKKPLIVSVTFFAGLVLLSAFVLLRELSSGRAFATISEPHSSTVEELEMPVIEAVTDMAFGKSPEEQPERRWTSPFMSNAKSIADDNPNSVPSVADRLLSCNLKRVIAVSPEGDVASAATVKLVRELADRGRRSILIDMTARGTLGLAMLDGRNRAGITELLSGDRRFNDVIHTDHYSQAHIMPLGKVEPKSAMRSAHRLPYIMDALETAYDFVVIEAGPCTAQQLRRIADQPAAVIMNIVDPDEHRVVTAALDMDKEGYEDVIILMDRPERATV